ncbi:MAG TPA: hypothetical protein VII31_08030, partial [Caldimonas sp.]
MRATTSSDATIRAPRAVLPPPSNDAGLVPMTSIFHRPLPRLAPALIAAGFVLALFSSPGRAADEPDAGGTFNTPGYPARATNPGTTAQPGTNGALPNAPSVRGNTGTANSRGSAPGQANNGNFDAFPRRSEPAPAPKPNEFQRFVEGATGRMLPIFGSSFFADAADTFQSLDNVPVSADYTIGPGDEIVTRA